MKTTAIVTAGGMGTRFGAATPKQFLDVCGKPMLIHTLDAFEKTPSVQEVILVLPKTSLSNWTPAFLQKFSIEKVSCIIEGGETRQASVFEGLKAIDSKPDFVAIHDGARCLITPEMIERTLSVAKTCDGAIAAVPVRDTLKKIAGEKIIDTIPRENVWSMQTPQVFRYKMILEAYQNAQALGLEATDDAMLAEQTGATLKVVPLSMENFKVTEPEDLDLATKILGQRHS